MRILLLSNYYPEHVGGIETVAGTLARGYRSRGHEVHWIAGDVSSCPHAGSPDDRAIRVWNGVERLGIPYPLPSPLALKSLHREIAWSDVVHMHDCLYAINAAAFAGTRRLRRPVLITQHIANVPYPNALYRGLQSLAYSTFGNAILEAADQVVFVSPAVQQAFESRLHFRRSPVLVPNGVDCALFHPVDDDERMAFRSRLGIRADQPLVLFVGQFKEKKGVALLRPVIESTPDWSWMMIGRPSDVDPAGWRLPNLTVVPPIRSGALRSYFGAADLVALPGREAFPVVAQESMACGTPVLLSSQTAAAIPGIQSLVFQSAPSPEKLRASLENALQSIASDRGGSRLRVADYARERWCSDVMVARYLELLSGLVGVSTAPTSAAGTTG